MRAGTGSASKDFGLACSGDASLRLSDPGAGGFGLFWAPGLQCHPHVLIDWGPDSAEFHDPNRPPWSFVAVGLVSNSCSAPPQASCAFLASMPASPWTNGSAMCWSRHFDEIDKIKSGEWRARFPSLDLVIRDPYTSDPSTWSAKRLVEFAIFGHVGWIWAPSVSTEPRSRPRRAGT
jgi:hypothetical protein